MMRHLKRSEAALMELRSPPGLAPFVCWHAVGMKWQLVLDKSDRFDRGRIALDYPYMRFVCPNRNRPYYLALYRQVLMQEAQKWLTPWFYQLSRDCNLPFLKLSYGQQRTLWGSCSSDQRIRLNVKLLYLPPRLVRYIMIHELCHTRYMNHQPDFWNLVAQHIPDYRELRRQLRRADQYIPKVLE
jgi:predicted metal-dependent hydrolase